MLQVVVYSGRCLFITSKDGLIEKGKRFQRLVLKVRERNITINPMTKTLEETAANTTFNQSIGIINIMQFILGIRYIKN